MIVQSFVELMQEAGASNSSLMFLEAMFLFGVLFLLWRLYTFTLLPIIRPQDPPELPYWIPVLGHALSFIKDAQTLVSRGKRYFKGSSEPFTLTVGGKKLYVVTSAADVNAVYKNNTTLSWDAMLNDLLIAFGVNPLVIPKLWEKPLSNTSVKTNWASSSKILSPIHATLDHYKRQLLPGERLDKFSASLFDYIDDSLHWEKLASRYGGTINRVSLSDFCAEILVEALSRTMFGDRIFELEPDLIQSMVDFNDDAWMLIFQYPQPPGSRLHVARRKLLDFFRNYMQAPKEMRLGQAWVIDRVMEELDAIDMRDEDKAPLLLMIYWGGNINPYKFAFWLLSYILFNPELLAALRTETRPALQDNKLNLAYLKNSCPRLNAVFLETLRVTSGALSARKVIAPTPLGDKILGAGNTVLIPLRQLHQNEAVFGDAPERFDPHRFLENRELRNSSSFKPFGGGVSHCPGQVLAKAEMLVFVALVLQRFDVELARDGLSQAFPVLDGSTPSLGVNGPVKGSDVFVRFRSLEA